MNQDFPCQVSTPRDFLMLKYEFLENMVYHRKTSKTFTAFALTGTTVMGCRSVNRPRTEAKANTEQYSTLQTGKIGFFLSKL